MIYSFIALGFTKSTLIWGALISPSLLAAALSGGFIAVAIDKKREAEGADRTKLPLRIAKTLLTVGFVAFCIVLALNGFSYSKWMDEDGVKSLRERYGYLDEVDSKTLQYLTVTELDRVDSPYVEASLSEENGLILVLRENFEGQVTIDVDGSKAVVTLKDAPRYPSAVWWAFDITDNYKWLMAQ